MGFTANPAKGSVTDELAGVLPQDGLPWYKKSHLIKLNFIIGSLVLFSSSNGYDGSLMNGLQALPDWHAFMNNPTGAWLGFINAIYWLGNGISFPIAAYVSNRFGRKPGVYVGYVFLVLGVCLQTAAQNETTFVLARMFLGAASAWFGNAVPLLINEIAFPTHRGICSALFMCGWYVGSTVAAWVTFGTRNYTTSWAWRIPSLLQVLIPLLALPGFLMVSESPRWLISKGRSDVAAKIIANYHTAGDTEAPLATYELFEIESALKFEKGAHSSASYADMIKTRGNRHRLFISVTLGIFGQWTGNGVVSYYLALVLQTVGITSVTQQTLISGCLQIWNLGFAVGAAFSVDKLGRRLLFLASAGTMLVSYVVVTGLSATFAKTQSPPFGIAVIPFLFIFFAGYDIAL
jgi:MFS family permease